jgi:hypothetical protein
MILFRTLVTCTHFFFSFRCCWTQLAWMKYIRTNTPTMTEFVVKPRCCFLMHSLFLIFRILDASKWNVGGEPFPPVAPRRIKEDARCLCTASGSACRYRTGDPLSTQSRCSFGFVSYTAPRSLPCLSHYLSVS